MGKVRTRILGVEEIEKEQKDKQRKKSQEKKSKAPAKAVKEVSGKEEEKKESKSRKIKKTKARIRGKNYQAAKKQVDSGKKYALDAALKLLKKMKFAKFDETVELHLSTDKDGLRGELDFPHSIGKTVRVRIADDKTLSEIEEGKIEFDILISHPSYMSKLAKLAKILGPRGLMPSPKSGTISDKPEEIAKKFEKGLTRWKSEVKFPLIHQSIGKISLEEKALTDNAKAFLKAVGKAHVKEGFIKTTMSPSVRLDLEQI